jgi:ubiquinone/menaquinone biosynthesis C-methylase UbiE
MPSLLRWVLVLFPHATELLKKRLAPRCGEHILEVGPGVGHHAIGIAPVLGSGGVLVIVDIQQPMLDTVRRRAVAEGITNIILTRADAQNLPYRDATFDGAYLSAVLGEVANRGQALRELRRVLKPGGRLVIGEVFFDPDCVPLSRLRQQAASAGLAFEDKTGSRFAYFARFRPNS